MAQIINPTKLTEELRAAGISIDGVGFFPDGSVRIDFKATATNDDRVLAQKVLAAHNGSMPDQATLTITDNTNAAKAALNGKKISLLTQADMQIIFGVLLAEHRWVQADGTIQIPSA